MTLCNNFQRKWGVGVFCEAAVSVFIAIYDPLATIKQAHSQSSLKGVSKIEGGAKCRQKLLLINYS